MSKCKKTSIFFEENLKLSKMLSKLLKLLMNFKKVQNQTSNQATINQKVNGNMEKEENGVTYDLAAARLVKMSEHELISFQVQF